MYRMTSWLLLGVYWHPRMDIPASGDSAGTNRNGAVLITGSSVDLISPFPLAALRHAYHWMHACRRITENDDSPASAEIYEQYMSLHLSFCISYGILARQRPSDAASTAAPSIGLLYFEPSGLRNGYLHIAMSRRAWGKGLADEAAQLSIRNLFDRLPALTRLSACMLEGNEAAQALARRMGFQLEGTLVDMVLQEGMPRNVVHYGLSRRDWERSQEVSSLSESVMRNQEETKSYG